MPQAAEFFVHAAILIPYFVAAIAGLWGLSAIARGVSDRLRESRRIRRGRCPACGAPAAGEATCCSSCGVEFTTTASRRLLRPVPRPVVVGAAAVAFAAASAVFANSVPTLLFGPRVGGDFGHYRWYALSAVGGCLAVGLILWGFFGDRAKGRKRCPRCWYNMAAVPSLTCPECGHDAGGPRGLRRTRRRWRAVTLGLLSLFAAELSRRGPQIQRSGWLAVVPTTVMIAALPALPDDWIARTRGPRMLEEDPSLRARVDRVGMWQWQKDWARSRALSLLGSADPARWLHAAALRGDRAVDVPGRGIDPQDLPAGFTDRLISALASPVYTVASRASDAAIVFLEPCAAQISASDPRDPAARLVEVVRAHGPGEPGAAWLLVRLAFRSPEVDDALLAALSRTGAMSQNVKEVLAESLASRAVAEPGLIPRLIAAADAAALPEREIIVKHVCAGIPDTPETLAWRRRLLGDPDLNVAADAMESLVRLPAHAAEANEAILRRIGEGSWIAGFLLHNEDLRPFIPRMIELLGSREAFSVDQAINFIREARSRHGKEILDPHRAGVVSILREPRIASPGRRRALRQLFDITEAESAPPAPAQPPASGKQ